MWNKGAGRCTHCGVELSREPRSGWHIDHFPVAFRDIEAQVCWGVRDARDVGNLVLSCPQCNMSHTHEEGRFCGHTQVPCRREWVTHGATAAAGFIAGALAALLGYGYGCRP